MISNQDFKKVQVSGMTSLALLLTEQLKAIGLTKGDKYYTYVEEIGGKKRIIIESKVG